MINARRFRRWIIRVRQVSADQRTLCCGKIAGDNGNRVIRKRHNSFLSIGLTGLPIVAEAGRAASLPGGGAA